MNFRDKKTTKKGDYAESLVLNYLEKQNYAVYATNSDRSHPFDFILTGNYKDALEDIFYFADVKAKSKRKWYPDTGIDIRAFNNYINIKNKFKVKGFILYFVDEENKQCYYGEIEDLKNNDRYVGYPLYKSGIVYFHIDSFNHAFDLTDEQVNRLIELTTKNNSYNI